MEKPHITTEEKDKILAAVKKAEEWIEEKEAAQAAASPYEKPVFESTEVPAQLKPVSLIFEKIANKPKPAPPVVEKVNATANATESNSTTEGSADEPVRVEINPETPAEAEKSAETTEKADASEEL
eukprot:GDKK01041793.1.p1 GENE.GDKK01041793.1~~GDKK01041793.1.p1  ORF type:complete len:126 (-),score=41.11 GDKK01041793.1:210-587(-)